MLSAWVVHESKIQVLRLATSRYLKITIDGLFNEAVILPRIRILVHSVSFSSQWRSQSFPPEFTAISLIDFRDCITV